MLLRAYFSFVTNNYSCFLFTDAFRDGMKLGLKFLAGHKPEFLSSPQVVARGSEKKEKSDIRSQVDSVEENLTMPSGLFDSVQFENKLSKSFQEFEERKLKAENNFKVCILKIVYLYNLILIISLSAVSSRKTRREKPRSRHSI